MTLQVPKVVCCVHFPAALLSHSVRYQCIDHGVINVDQRPVAITVAGEVKEISYPMEGRERDREI